MQLKSISCKNQSNQFCKRSHPLLEKIHLQYKRDNMFDSKIVRQIIDELELIDIEVQGDCSCRTAINIMVEASNFTKWIRLLFAEQESKFNKSAVEIPSQFQQVKNQIQQLIYNLQLKMLASTISNQPQQQEQSRFYNKKRRISKKRKPKTIIQRRFSANKVKIQEDMQSEQQNIYQEMNSQSKQQNQEDKINQ